MQVAINTKTLPQIPGARICILKSKWYQEFADNMERAAVPLLKNAGVAQIDSFVLPGCLEMPLAIKHLEDHSSQTYDAYICFGTLMKGKTLHFEMILNETGRGLGEVMLQYNKPILVGIIPAISLIDVKKRTRMDKLNKGIESAAAAIEIIAWRRERSAR